MELLIGLALLYGSFYAMDLVDGLGRCPRRRAELKPRSSVKQHDRGDYIVVGQNGKGRPIYEHRVIAERILRRKLLRGEVVHHINGRRNDNRPPNLCVMQNQAHKNFHAWNDWIKKTYGRYPGREKQLKKIKDDLGGLFLDETGAKDDEARIVGRTRQILRLV